MGISPARFGRNARCRGVSVVYVVVVATVLMGFGALAIDFGRAQTARSELRCVAEEAARAGAANLSLGSITSKNRVKAVAARNQVDGMIVAINDADIQFLRWNNSNDYTVLPSTTGANAVRVYVRRTAANGNAFPLMFARSLGMPTMDVSATSIAARIEDSSEETNFDAADSNVSLAGERVGSINDGERRNDVGAPPATIASTEIEIVQ